MRVRKGRALLALGLAAAGSVAAVPAPVSADSGGWVGDLCVRAQKQTSSLNETAFAAAGGTLTNVNYPDTESFKESKPQVQPLTTDSYVTYEDAAKTLPQQVRCKGKTSDHLNTVYGANVAGPEQDCKVVNATTVADVFASLTPDERARLVYPENKVVISVDWPAFTGPDWLLDFPAASKGWDGKLHVQSKKLQIPWSWSIFPESFRGQHYCTLIAPAYFKRLILGEAQV